MSARAKIRIRSAANRASKSLLAVSFRWVGA